MSCCLSQPGFLTTWSLSLRLKCSLWFRYAKSLSNVSRFWPLPDPPLQDPEKLLNYSHQRSPDTTTDPALILLSVKTFVAYRIRGDTSFILVIRFESPFAAFVYFVLPKD